MNKENLNLFQQIVQAHNITCTIVEKDFSNLYKTDLELRYKLYSDYDYSDFRDYLLRNCKPGHILKIYDEFSLISYALCLPPSSETSSGPTSAVPSTGSETGGPEDTGEPVTESDGTISDTGIVTTENTYLVAGPVLKEPCTLADIQKIMFKNKLPDMLYKDLSAFYAKLPVPPNTKTLEATLLVIAENLFSEKYDLQEPLGLSSITFDSSSAFRRLNQDPSLAISSIEERYELENQFLDMISTGNYNAAARLYAKLNNYRITPRNPNSILNRKNLLIILNTLCRKAVERGNVHPVYIDELSTRLAIQINEAETDTELDQIEGEMIHKYCLLVRNGAEKSNGDPGDHHQIYCRSYWQQAETPCRRLCPRLHRPRRPGHQLRSAGGLLHELHQGAGRLGVCCYLHGRRDFCDQYQAARGLQGDGGGCPCRKDRPHCHKKCQPVRQKYCRQPDHRADAEGKGCGNLL